MSLVEGNDFENQRHVHRNMGHLDWSLKAVKDLGWAGMTGEGIY